MDAVNKRFRRIVNKIILVKEAGDCCNVCKNKFEYRHYDFHHLDPTDKDVGVALLLVRSLDVAREEAAKCIVVCKKCHNDIHLEDNKDVANELAELIENNIDDYKRESGKINYKKLLKKVQA